MHNEADIGHFLQRQKISPVPNVGGVRHSGIDARIVEPRKFFPLRYDDQSMAVDARAAQARVRERQGDALQRAPVRLVEHCDAGEGIAQI